MKLFYDFQNNRCFDTQFYRFHKILIIFNSIFWIISYDFNLNNLLNDILINDLIWLDLSLLANLWFSSVWIRFNMVHCMECCKWWQLTIRLFVYSGDFSFGLLKWTSLCFFHSDENVQSTWKYMRNTIIVHD